MHCSASFITRFGLDCYIKYGDKGPQTPKFSKSCLPWENAQKTHAVNFGVSARAFFFEVSLLTVSAVSPIFGSRGKESSNTWRNLQPRRRKSHKSCSHINLVTSLAVMGFRTQVNLSLLPFSHVRTSRIGADPKINLANRRGADSRKLCELCVLLVCLGKPTDCSQSSG